MKKKKTNKSASSKIREMRPEYDFTGGVRGKHETQYAKGTNIVVIDPDVAEVFPDSASVNEVLRALIPIMNRQKERRGGPDAKA